MKYPFRKFVILKLKICSDRKQDAKFHLLQNRDIEGFVAFSRSSVGKTTTKGPPGYTENLVLVVTASVRTALL